MYDKLDDDVHEDGSLVRGTLMLMLAADAIGDDEVVRAQTSTAS